MPSKNKPVSPNKVKLDPIFSIPAGAEDVFVYTRDVTDGNNLPADPNSVDTLDSGEFIDDTESGGGDGEDNDFALATPTDFSIISQTLRRSTGGQHVIDVVIGIGEVQGAIDYEIQMVAG